MATQFSMLGIINAALLAQGQEEVSVNDGSLEWRVLASNWPKIVESELEDGNYVFTSREKFPATRAPGRFGFQDAYVVPDEALHVRKLTVDANGIGTDINWTQDGTYVYVDKNDGYTIQYVVVQEPDFWGANFASGIQRKLEGIILRSIKEEHYSGGHARPCFSTSSHFRPAGFRHPQIATEWRSK